MTENGMKPLLAIAIGLAWATFAGQAWAGGDPVAGKEKSAPCAACHGETGNGPNPQFPRLAGQYANYIVRALEEYKSGARQNPIMAAFAAQLGEQDREDLAAYFASQQGELFTITYGQ